MKCQELQDLVLFAAAGVLDADEQRQVQEHLSDGCPRCEGYRAEAEAVLAQLSMSVAPVQPSASVKRALMTRVRQSLEPSRPAMNLRLPWWRVALPASIAAMLAVVITAGAFKAFPGLSGRGAAPQIVKVVPVPVPAPNNEASIFSGFTVNQVTGHDIKQVELTSDAQKPANGRLILDITDHIWSLNINGLRPTTGNELYYIWVYGSDNVAHQIGTFKLASQKPDFGSLDKLPKLDLQHQVQFLITVQTEPAVSIPGHRQMVGYLNP